MRFYKNNRQKSRRLCTLCRVCRQAELMRLSFAFKSIAEMKEACAYMHDMDPMDFVACVQMPAFQLGGMWAGFARCEDIRAQRQEADDWMRDVEMWSLSDHI